MPEADKMILILLVSFGMTLLLEFPIVWILGVRGKHNLLLAFLVNVITNPAVVLVYYLLRYFVPQNARTAQYLLEIGVVLVEFYYYKKYGRNVSHPFWVALAANLFSYFMGLIINKYIF